VVPGLTNAVFALTHLEYLFPYANPSALEKDQRDFLTGEVTDQDASHAVDPIAELLESLI